jgi:filamentous hemagglutinin family protein
MGGQRANALPQGEAVAHGKANFKRDGGRMEIRASDRAVINFRGFNIDRNEAVTFVQPGAKSRVLNRVTDGNPTRIFGQLKANGHVTLVNPSGVFFQNGAMVNVGGIIAAAGKISDADFLAGRNRFTELSGEVNNAGTIRAKGDVSLLGAHVSNSGIIHSGKGLVSLVAGDEVLVGERGGNVYVSGAATPGKASKAGVSNTGKIVAKKALLGAGDFYSVAVQHSGEIRAEEVAVRGGKGGRVEVSGKIDASARGKGKKGGRIEVTGETVALAGAKLDASGDKGGGEVLVGGDWQGGGTVSRAQTTTVDAATVIHADALRNGPGGKVVVWADGATQFDGRISARGLGAGQAGGQVETSGKLTLGVGQTARVDASSPGGKPGQWLLDPTNLTIRDGVNIGGINDPTGDVFVDASVINVALSTANTSVTLSATQDITFMESILGTGARSGLTATAGRNLKVNDGVTIATNNGAINFTADSDKDGTGFLELKANSKLTTKGAAVNLTVDHGSATSTDGIKIFGNIDTRPPGTGFGATSRFELKGSAQTGALEVGAVALNAGQDADYGHGDFDFYADEINFTGVSNSVQGTGHLNLRPSSLSTSVKFLSANDDIAGQMDLTPADLKAISSQFSGTNFGRSEPSYDGTLIIGDSGGAALEIARSAASKSQIAFESGPRGIIANVKVRALNTSLVEFRGNVVDLKNGLEAPSATVSFLSSGHTPIEILDMTKTGQGVEAGKLRLHTAMLKTIGDTCYGLQIGSFATDRNTTLTVLNPLELTGADVKDERLILQTGGAVIFNAAVNAGAKTLQISAGTIDFKSVASDIRGAKTLTISPSNSTEGKESTRDVEVYETTPVLTSNALTIKKSDLDALAANFSSTLTIGDGTSSVGGNLLINTPLGFSGKTITGLILKAAGSVVVNKDIALGTVGAGATYQSLEINGREVDLNAGVSGRGELTIQPVTNKHQTDNPMTRGMVVGVTSQDANRLTLSEAEYARIGNTFKKIHSRPIGT